MLKWKIATVMGVAFGIAGIGWGSAQQRQAPGFYELRVYTALPGKRDALAERFANYTAAIFARHGITNVGYWIPQQSVQLDQWWRVIWWSSFRKDRRGRTA